MSETERIVAPWNNATARALNAFQQRKDMHPFTCPEEHKVDGVYSLVASGDGWFCPDDGCGYTQNWAHAFMAEVQSRTTVDVTAEDKAALEDVIDEAATCEWYRPPREVVDAIIAAGWRPPREVSPERTTLDLVEEVRGAGYLVIQIPSCKRDGHDHGKHVLVTKSAMCPGAGIAPHGAQTVTMGTLGLWVNCSCGDSFSDYGEHPTKWEEHRAQHSWIKPKEVK
jgi:hypothetical protein